MGIDRLGYIRWVCAMHMSTCKFLHKLTYVHRYIVSSETTALTLHRFCCFCCSRQLFLEFQIKIPKQWLSVATGSALMSSLFFVIQIFHGWRQVWNVGRISPADKAQQSIHNSTNASRESKDNAFLATPKSRCVDVGWNSKSQAAAESKKSSQQDACAYRAYAPLLCVGCAVGGGSFVLSTQRQQNFIVEAFQ